MTGGKAWSKVAKTHAIVQSAEAVQASAITLGSNESRDTEYRSLSYSVCLTGSANYSTKAKLRIGFRRRLPGLKQLASFQAQKSLPL